MFQETLTDFNRMNFKDIEKVFVNKHNDLKGKLLTNMKAEIKCGSSRNLFGEDFISSSVLRLM